eukprot:TRINITY_DN10552_c0_g1_i1.p1 TRINITY_DN10552_c0_g1~~TRINITY_DN10552_c0_g1_i1.p1  ORF type:complete len:221 (-),score=43.98 TRINITY_DN10552_c0_g1_i1:59-721(-)
MYHSLSEVNICTFSPLTNSYPIPSSRFILWDTLGWRNGLYYTQNEFEQMLEGQIPSRQSLLNDVKKFNIPNELRKISAVVFVVNHLAMQCHEDVREMKRYHDSAKERGLIVAMIVTQMDKDEASLRDITDYPTLKKRLSNNSTFRRIRTFVQDVWANDDLEVFPVINYEAGDTLKDETKELTVSAVMDYILVQLSKVENEEIEPFDPFAGEIPVVSSFAQ